MKKKMMKDTKHKLPKLTTDHQLTDELLQKVVGGGGGGPLPHPPTADASW